MSSKGEDVNAMDTSCELVGTETSSSGLPLGVTPPPTASSLRSSSEVEKERGNTQIAGTASNALSLSYSAKYGISSPRVRLRAPLPE